MSKHQESSLNNALTCPTALLQDAYLLCCCIPSRSLLRPHLLDKLLWIMSLLFYASLKRQVIDRMTVHNHKLI